jgi:hypothetical protein
LCSGAAGEIDPKCGTDPNGTFDADKAALGADKARPGYREIRLYTHQTMVENQRLYASIGYEETGRGSEAGYDRVSCRL